MTTIDADMPIEQAVWTRIGELHARRAELIALEDSAELVKLYTELARQHQILKGEAERVSCAVWCINVAHTDIGCDGRDCYEVPAEVGIIATGGWKTPDGNGVDKWYELRVYPGRLLSEARDRAEIGAAETHVVHFELVHEGWGGGEFANMTVPQAIALRARLDHCITLAEADAEQLRAGLE